MLERNFSQLFGRWAKANMPHSAAFELKVCKTALPWNAVKPHQVDGLVHAAEGRLYLKIPDCGYSAPFDSFMLVGVPAYVVVRFGSGEFYMIHILDFIYAREHSKRKSLTEEEAQYLDKKPHALL